MPMLRVEFDHGGRTYTIESPSLNMWRVRHIAGLNTKMTVETDLRTGESIFVTWSEIGVIRLVSRVDADGFALANPPVPAPDARPGSGGTGAA